MAFSQTGANYKNQSELQRKDRILGEALDDLASQVQSVRKQGNFGQSGAVAAPHPLSSISVSAAAGFATVALTHANAPAGTSYVIEYSTTPNFKSPVRVDNGISLSYHQYLKGQTLYFRAAPMVSASALAQWSYFGSQASPTAVAF